MDVGAVRTALVAVVDAAIASLNCYSFVPNNPAEPCFYPGEYEVDFHKAFKSGMDSATLTFRVLVSAADEKSQLQLNDYLATGGGSSIKLALENARGTVSGCDDFVVSRMDAYRRYTIGACEYYGADLTVYVIGTGV